MAAPPAADRLLTAEEFMELPALRTGGRVELVRGRVLCAMASSVRANEVSIAVAAEIRAFVRPRRLGRCGGSEGGFRVRRDPATVRSPDAWFVIWDRLIDGRLPDSFFDGAPDLAVETLSPTDRAIDIFERVRDYLETGTRLVWVIDPTSRSAVVFRRSGVPSFLHDDDEFDGEDVIPGFRLRLGDVLD